MRKVRCNAKPLSAEYRPSEVSPPSLILFTPRRICFQRLSLLVKGWCTLSVGEHCARRRIGTFAVLKGRVTQRRKTFQVRIRKFSTTPLDPLEKNEFPFTIKMCLREAMIPSTQKNSPWPDFLFASRR